MYLAGVAVVSLSLCFDTVLNASGVGSVPPSGGSCCLHHQCCSAEHSAGGSAGARLEPGQSLDGWVLPLALATGSEERLSFTLPLSVSASEVSVWAALALMALAVTLVERGVRFAETRGRVSPATGFLSLFSSATNKGGGPT